MAPAAGVADGGDVIDIDAEAQVVAHAFSLRMILSENRFPLFGIMR
jgi:hypothetical protein